MVSETESVPEVKKCFMCQSTIPFAAMKCTECDSYQGWRRFLGLSSSILTLLIALFSVLGLVVPVLLTTFDDKVAQLSVARAVIVEDKIEVALVNYGERSAYVSSIGIHTEAGLFRNFRQTITKVNPDDIVLEEFSLTGSEVSNLARFSNCSLRITQVLDGAEGNIIERSVECRQ